MTDRELLEAAARAAEHSELVKRMGDEAFKALLLDPCKLTPALDAAVSAYLKATQEQTR